MTRAAPRIRLSNSISPPYEFNPGFEACAQDGKGRVSNASGRAGTCPCGGGDGP
jgi:hypothetical protein